MPARPAGDTCSSARGRRHAFASAFGRSSRGAGLGQRLLERLVAEHRALQPGRADVDPEEVEQVVGAEGLDVGRRGLPLISSVRSDALAWLIAQPRPVNPTRSTTPSSDPELERDPVAAQGVAALEGRGRHPR